MKKMVKGAVLGGLVLFVWGMISWTVFPWHKHNMMQFKDSKQVAQVVQDNAPESGVYILNMGEDKASQAPSVFAAVSYQHKEHAQMMVEGFIFKVIVAFVVTWLVFQTKLNDKKRVGFITVVGVAIALSAHLPQWIWCGYPAGFTLAMMVDTVIGWVLAGAVIAKITK